MEDKQKELIGNLDAKFWAEEFIKRAKEDPSFAIDEGNMIGWFANAIMTGYDNMGGVKIDSLKNYRCMLDVNDRPIMVEVEQDDVYDNFEPFVLLSELKKLIK